MMSNIILFIVKLCIINLLYWVLCGVLLGINPGARVRVSLVKIRGIKPIPLLYITQMTKFTFVLSVWIYVSISKLGVSFDIATLIFILHFYIYNRFEVWYYLKILYEAFNRDKYDTFDDYLRSIGYK